MGFARVAGHIARTGSALVHSVLAGPALVHLALAGSALVHLVLAGLALVHLVLAGPALVYPVLAGPALVHPVLAGPAPVRFAAGHLVGVPARPGSSLPAHYVWSGPFGAFARAGQMLRHFSRPVPGHLVRALPNPAHLARRSKSGTP